jgi:hypothetical protein
MPCSFGINDPNNWNGIEEQHIYLKPSNALPIPTVPKGSLPLFVVYIRNQDRKVFTCKQTMTQQCWKQATKPSDDFKGIPGISSGTPPFAHLLAPRATEIPNQIRQKSSRAATKKNKIYDKKTYVWPISIQLLSFIANFGSPSLFRWLICIYICMYIVHFNYSSRWGFRIAIGGKLSLDTRCWIHKSERGAKGGRELESKKHLYTAIWLL